MKLLKYVNNIVHNCQFLRDDGGGTDMVGRMGRGRGAVV